ncbi:MAG: flagellar basal body rod protein FlgB [Bdellovibrionota bacterium]|nr:flagellar basal body rod protein FlgB [Pseudobdellovibrionaceae bacterium]|tara:strand:+ start:161123 stop:161530 length:408 start_codon:yes stop_codon:yes gene_type:complete
MSMFDKTTKALEKSLDFMLLRQNVVSANVANAETPGYKAKKVDFEEKLSSALDLNGPNQMKSAAKGHFPVGHNHLNAITADVYDNPDVAMNNDGNTVDMEKEMATLNENSIRYKAATQLINKKLGKLKYAITGGR